MGIRSSKNKIYNSLVNKNAGIREKYHEYHDGTTGIKKWLSYAYLGSLNFQYYILGRRSLRSIASAKYYEVSDIKPNESQSAEAAARLGTPREFAESLLGYDVVSFDVFDTLIFRPFSEPTDLFHFVGLDLKIPNFKSLRMEMERKARERHYRVTGNNEVNLEEIWNYIEEKIGVDATKGMNKEIALEKYFCYSNPFMLEVWNILKANGVKTIVLSDMYLPKAVIEDILVENGYHGADEIIVSCESGRSKSAGDAFEYACENNLNAIHVGDNMHSDFDMPKEHGWDAVYYDNTDIFAKSKRPYDMSSIVGGAYRGVINHALLSGKSSYTPEYEYGFIYGGIFVLGYCNFIHSYCKSNGIDKILFLSRDGDILKQVYDYLYPGENTSYFLWSRLAGVKVMARYNKYDYYRRFIHHKVNQGYSVRSALRSMELGALADEMKSPSPNAELSAKNADDVENYLDDNFDKVMAAYDGQIKATEVMLKRELEGCSRVAVVDIGWAGSGALSLDYLAGKVLGLPCEITGIVAGTNTIHNEEPDASESFLQSGKLVSYLYSQSHNRDLLKKHDPSKGYNLFWELLLSSTEPSFQGYYMEGGEVVPHFYKTEENISGIIDIQKGIKDFVIEYTSHFKQYTFMMNISGRDAYAPLLAAAGRNEKYLRRMLDRFSINPEIN